MTVAKIKEMINNMADTDEVKFVTEEYDRDGFPYETVQKIIAIVPKSAERVNVGCGIMRYKR